MLKYCSVLTSVDAQQSFVRFCSNIYQRYRSKNCFESLNSLKQIFCMEKCCQNRFGVQFTNRLLTDVCRFLGLGIPQMTDRCLGTQVMDALLRCEFSHVLTTQSLQVLFAFLLMFIKSHSNISFIGRVVGIKLLFFSYDKVDLWELNMFSNGVVRRF